MTIGAALTVFGLPVPGLSILGVIIFIVGAVARFVGY